MMPLVGCLVPICAQLHVCNTDTGEFNVYGNGDENPPQIPKDMSNIIKELLHTLQIKFHVLVVVDPAHRYVKIPEIYTMVHGFSINVYIIPSLMARFMAVFDYLQTNLHKVWVFAMITHAAGAECQILRSYAKSDNSFNLVMNRVVSEGVQFDIASFPHKPKRIIYVTFDYGHAGRPIHLDYPAPLPAGLNFDHVHFRDLMSMLFQGGLAKACQYAGDRRLPFVADFVDSIYVQVNGEYSHLLKAGCRLPVETKFWKTLNRKSAVQINSGFTLGFLNGLLKRINVTLFHGTYHSDFVEITVRVNQYGLISFTDNHSVMSLSTSATKMVSNVLIKATNSKVTSSTSRVSASLPEAKTPWKYQNVIGYRFMSTKFILHGNDGIPIEVVGIIVTSFSVTWQALPLILTS